MIAEDIIRRLRKEIDRMYEDYEGTSMIEQEAFDFAQYTAIRVSVKNVKSNTKG